MVLPYHLIKVCGSTVFAAQGSDIHSFNSALEYVSTWKYPAQQVDESNSPPAEAQESPAQEEPPIKRRKVEPGQEQSPKGRRAKSTNGQPKNNKGAKHQGPGNERPFVQGLYATTDGRHLVAVTGAMPKRPCSLALTRDNLTILSADKFGDVYALPLLPSPIPPTTTSATASATTPSAPSPPASGLDESRSASTTPSTATPNLFKPQATALTVHTKRNLRALEHQKISLSRRALEEQLSRPHTTVPNDDGQGGERAREYILTADRDEHIRVSRGMPQAHVIERFCLGHEDFVSRLCVAPGGRAGVLISGGGDDDLFVWDWAEGRLLGRAGVLEHVKGVVGGGGEGGEAGVSKVAVTRVFACGWEGGVGVFVVVERVPALFRYELLEDNTLQHRETISTPGNPLDIEALEAPGATPRLLVAVYPNGSAEGSSSPSSFIALDKEETGWRQTDVENLPAGGDIDISDTELQKLLYSTETLRKLSDFD
ncbi:hypothetical protein CHGG_00975 [Chaetomium globosum CBS 148.51]|uniref:Uncharacterized protein n=1 Tax=Chaetomium globosum (strain ATCC 6205 / CBS 148.51 / DSM 1962 / NBRC 6347 / NRRL 1970) TaxID=306901 RepID=Q2HFM9_CHAGB|nr:uncharacterized protein CHGG_00975 [Chaetomium globosum CBS 148.51]EAQ92740.1 hypothetical protein CHGG_00975 [Chaetomium globosum CBS 148.51]